MNDILIPSPVGDVTAHFNAPVNALAAVIVIHEVWGLNPHTRDIADRLAELGYASLAPDLLSHTGITDTISPEVLQRAANPETRDVAQKELRAAMAPLQAPEFGEETLARLQAIYAYLKDKGYAKIGVIGFCFGGSYSWTLAVNEPTLAAALVFYGQAPAEDQMAAITAPVYGFYGETDAGLTDAVPAVAVAMKAAGKAFEYVIYPGAGHAFFNDTNPTTYQAEAANAAWIRVQEILATRLSCNRETCSAS